MMRFSMSVAAIAASVAAVVFACGGQAKNVQPSTTMTTAAGVTQSAIHDIANARCDREELCNNVGSSKKYATRDACVNEMRDKGKDELKASDCPSGVDSQQLDKCLAEIRGERCGNPLDTVSRLTACRSSAICPK